MEEGGGKAINIGVSIIITLTIIAVVITIVTAANRMASTGASRASETAAKMEEEQYTRYDGMTISGDQIATLIKQYSGDEIAIVVNNGSAETSYINTGEGFSTDGKGTLTEGTEETLGVMLNNASKRSDAEHYISPTRKFIGYVCRDEATDGIVGLYFTPAEPDTP